jgi:hypothetical protein
MCHRRARDLLAWVTDLSSPLSYQLVGIVGAGRAHSSNAPLGNPATCVRPRDAVRAPAGRE